MNSINDNESTDATDSYDDIFDEDVPEKPEPEKPISSRWDLQESWANLEEAAPTDVQKGDIIPGTVVAVQDQYIIVDIGAKFEGMVPRNEFAEGEELPAENDEIRVAVVRVDDEAGQITLSKKRADYEQAWEKLYRAQQNGEVLTGMVTDRVRGGLRVDVGMPGFVPASHVAIRDVRKLNKLIGKVLKLKVLEVDRRRNQIVLSHRQVVEEERTRRREETLSRLEEGVVCEGRVRNITNYGAFVDLGGVDGLLHISEMAWSHVDHPSDVVTPGEIIRVMVLDIEKDGERISLGRRQLLPNPWTQAANQLEAGSLYEAVIARVVDTGAFASLKEADVEGFIPLRELSSQHIDQAKDVVSKGQKVKVKLLDLDATAHKMTLSLMGAEAESDRQEYEEYMKSQQAPPVKLGDQFGEVLNQTKASLVDSEQPDKDTDEPTEQEQPDEDTDEPAESEQPDEDTDEPAEPEQPDEDTDEPTESEQPDKDTDEPAEQEPADEQAETLGPDEPAPTAPAEPESSTDEADAEPDEAEEPEQPEAIGEEEVS